MKLLLTIFICLLISVGYAVAQVGYKAGKETATPKPETVELSYVIDGDTIRLKGGEYVRLIGINSPEIKSEDEQEKCFAYKSKEYLLNLLKDKEFRLEADSSQADKDRYGRSLRYVFVGDVNINKVLVQQGFAYEYTYSKPYKYQSEFKEAQKSAEESKFGIWDEKECK